MSTSFDSIATPRSAEGGSKAWATVVLGCINCFFLGGIINGWAPLELILLQDDVYLDSCPDPLIEDCVIRKGRLIFLFTLASAVATLSSPLGGWITDAVGPAKCTILSGFLVSAGLLLLGIAKEQGLALGCVMLATGGLFDLLNSFPLAFIVPPESRPLVMSACNCLYDASSVVFLFVYWIYNFGGFSRRTIFTGYAIFSVVLHGALAAQWASGPERILEAAQAKEFAPPDQGPEEEDEGSEFAPRVQGLALTQQLKTFEFWFATVFMSIQMFRSGAYLGTAGSLLKTYGDEDKDYLYTQLFTASLPLSLFCVPLINRTLTNRGFKVAYPVITFLGIVFNAICLVGILPVQLLSFAAFTNFRAFLYSAHFTYIGHTFGPKTSARIGGFIFFAGALLTFSISPIVTFFNRRSGHLWEFYFLLLVLNVPLVAMVAKLVRRLREQPADDCCFKPPEPFSETQPAKQLTSSFICLSALHLQVRNRTKSSTFIS